jgi:hypothetical protein
MATSRSGLPRSGCARRSTRPGAEPFRAWFAVLETSGVTRITSAEWLVATGLVARSVGRSTHRQPRSRLPQIRVTSDVAASETYASGLALARAFGSTVLEPSWWPEDVEEIRCCLARFSAGHAHYEILSTRGDGTPVGVIGHVRGSGDRSPREWLDGEWSEPRELKEMRGLIDRVGIPARLQGSVYDQELEMHLIGYNTEDEIVSTVSSLRRVSPG